MAAWIQFIRAMIQEDYQELDRIIDETNFDINRAGDIDLYIIDPDNTLELSEEMENDIIGIGYPGRVYPINFAEVIGKRMFMYLLEKGAKLDYNGNEGPINYDSGLQFYFKREEYDFLKELVNKSYFDPKNPRFGVAMFMDSLMTTKNYTPEQKEKYLDFLQFLLDHGADVNASRFPYDYKFPLQIAVSDFPRPFIEVIDFLLDRGADFYKKAPKRRSFSVYTDEYLIFTSLELPVIKKLYDEHISRDGKPPRDSMGNTIWHYLDNRKMKEWTELGYPIDDDYVTAKNFIGQTSREANRTASNDTSIIRNINEIMVNSAKSAIYSLAKTGKFGSDHLKLMYYKIMKDKLLENKESMSGGSFHKLIKEHGIRTDDEGNSYNFYEKMLSS